MPVQTRTLVLRSMAALGWLRSAVGIGGARDCRGRCSVCRPQTLRSCACLARGGGPVAPLAALPQGARIQVCTGTMTSVSSLLEQRWRALTAGQCVCAPGADVAQEEFTTKAGVPARTLSPDEP